MSNTVRDWNFEETLRRELAADVRADADTQTVELSFSSELAVERGGYSEVLSHEPEHMDLSRLSDGAHPLLINHDHEKQVGVVERAWLDTEGKKGRASVRFSKSPLGQEVWQDVKDGIRRLVSVGYRRTKEVEVQRTDGKELIRFAWQPYEVSIVSIPADASVGIGRSQPQVSEAPKVTITMENDYKKSAAEILAIAKNLDGKVENVRDLAMQAVSEGKSVEEFRAACLANVPSIKPLEKPVLSDVKPKEWQNYSLSRAIRGQLSGRLEGFEGEMSQEIEKRTGQSASGFWMPSEALLKRTHVAGTGTLGGMVVATDNLGSQMIELLRDSTVAGQMGAKILQLANPVTIPRQAGAGTANWINGETAASTLSAMNFTQLTLSPKAVSAMQQYSKQLLATSDPSIDGLIRDDINQIIALAIDYAVLHGGGASGVPAGITATTGINTVALGENGAAWTTANCYPSLVSMETEVATDFALKGSLGYVMNTTSKGKCKSITKTGLDSVFVWEPGNTVNGYKVGVTNQLLTNLTKGTSTTVASAVVFGNWSDVLIGEFNGGAMDVLVDPYTAGANAVVRIICRKWLDLGIRHPQSFAVILDLLN